MRYFFILFTLLLLLAKTAHAQRLNDSTSTNAKSYQYYMKKRDTYNTIGWVCVGTGLTMAAVGLLADIGSAFRHGSGKKGDGIVVAGEVVVFAGIPFFIIAHNNKKKAKLSVSNGAINMNGNTKFKKNYTQLSLVVNF